jgi:hypothetical protein
MYAVTIISLAAAVVAAPAALEKRACSPLEIVIG